MTRLTLSIFEFGNDSFVSNESHAVANILAHASRKIRDEGIRAGQTFWLRDENGNVVGEVVVE